MNHRDTAQRIEIPDVIGPKPKYFLDARAGKIATRQYPIMVLPWHRLVVVDVIIVARGNPEKGYRLGSYGLN
jgi:hypothetical protein